MVGLDGSRELLRYARANAPDVPLVQSDVRQFGMRACFDAVICVFDSLNHLLSSEDLSAAFRCVAACIRPGGWFLFDLNTEAGYLAHWHGCHTMDGEGHIVRTWSRYDRRSRMAWFKAETEKAGGSDCQKRGTVLWQRCHSTGEISQALQDAGLVLVETHGLERESFVAGSLEGAERLFYLCRRPTKARVARAVEHEPGAV